MRPVEQAFANVAGLHLGICPLWPLSLPEFFYPKHKLSPGATCELDLPVSISIR